MTTDELDLEGIERVSKAALDSLEEIEDVPAWEDFEREVTPHVVLALLRRVREVRALREIEYRIRRARSRRTNAGVFLSSELVDTLLAALDAAREGKG